MICLDLRKETRSLHNGGYPPEAARVGGEACVGVSDEGSPPQETGGLACE